MAYLLGFTAGYVGVILLICIFVALFYMVIALIFRPFVLWYFKINRQIERQDETNRLLAEMLDRMPDRHIPDVPHRNSWDHSAYMPK